MSHNSNLDIKRPRAKVNITLSQLLLLVAVGVIVFLVAAGDFTSVAKENESVSSSKVSTVEQNVVTRQTTELFCL